MALVSAQNRRTQDQFTHTTDPTADISKYLIMAQYNFQRTRRGSDASEDAHAMDFAPPAPIMNPSANWIAPGYPPFGSFGGSTAAHPYLGLEFAPSVAAGSGG